MTRWSIAYLLLLLLAVYTPCQAQNLVPNPSFEQYNKCPDIISGIEYSPNYTSFTYIKDWASPAKTGSPDYFNSCAPSSSYVTVPINAFGTQAARTGNAYAGIIAWDGRNINGNMTIDFAEYLQCKLTQPMVAGKRYCVTFFVNNAVSNTSYNFVGIDKVSVNFSKTKPTENNGFSLNLNQHISNNAGSYITDTAGWVKVDGVYAAQGGEEWLTLGWFNNGTPPSFQPVLPTSPNSADKYRSYLFVDDVTVVEIKSFDTTKNVHDSTWCTFPINMTLKSAGEYGDYKWSNGTIGSTLNVHDTGTFWCVSYAQCHTYIDTYRVRYAPAPKLDLGKELIDCNNEPVTILSNYPNSSYLWSNGATSDRITVNKSGVYTLTINNKCGTQQDSVHVYIQPPTPTPAPVDTSICQFVSEPALLVNGDNIRWYTHIDGVISSNIQPPIVTHEPGSYHLYATQTLGKCESEKVPVNVLVKYAPHEELGERLVMCDNDLKMIGNHVSGVKYKWNFGSTTCCILPTIEGRYMRSAENECGSYIDTVQVYHTPCEDCVEFPNAFTPMEGRGNQEFKALVKCPVEKFHMRIYNRWGNLVFETNDVKEGWAGRSNYQYAPMGVYIYIVDYTAKGKRANQVKQGNVTLIR